MSVAGTVCIKHFSSLNLMHEAAQATSCHNFSSRSTYFFTPMSSRMRNFRATSGSALIHSFIYHDAPLHSRGRDNVNIMFPPTRCDVFISGHGADRRRGRVTGAEVTLTAVAAVLVFLVVPLALAPPFPGCETKASGTTPLEVVLGICDASSGRPWLLGSGGAGGREWGGGEGRGFRPPA